MLCGPGPPAPPCRPARRRLAGLRAAGGAAERTGPAGPIRSGIVGRRRLRPPGGPESDQGDGLDAARVVVCRPVDVGRDRPGRHVARRVRMERHVLAREPGVPDVRRQDDRNVAMHRRHRLVGGGGEDRAGLYGIQAPGAGRKHADDRAPVRPHAGRDARALCTSGAGFGAGLGGTGSRRASPATFSGGIPTPSRFRTGRPRRARLESLSTIRAAIPWTRRVAHAPFKLKLFLKVPRMRVHNGARNSGGTAKFVPRLLPQDNRRRQRDYGRFLHARAKLGHAPLLPVFDVLRR